MSKFVRLKKFSSVSVSQLWSLTIAARKMPKGFYQINPISFVKSNEAEMFVLGKDLESFSSSSSDALVQGFFNEWYTNYQSAKMSLDDLDALSFSSLSNEVLYKVYSIVTLQSSEVSRMFFFSKMLEATNSGLHSKLRSLFLEKSVSEEGIIQLSLNLFKEGIFEEIGRRIYKRRQDTLLMSPEEFHSALYGGVFEEEELEERKSNYIVVYDLEKDAPHVYSGEKARAMEASLLR